MFDEDGWYRTGDVGVLDADGYLTITDRISDIIIRGGENISAAEIEELLMGMDQVAEVCVVAEPDERLGEHAAAVVRVRDGMAPPTMAEMRAHLAQAGLTRQKWPEALYRGGRVPENAVREGAEVRAPTAAARGVDGGAVDDSGPSAIMSFSFLEINDILLERAHEEERPHGALPEAG